MTSYEEIKREVYLAAMEAKQEFFAERDDIKTDCLVWAMCGIVALRTMRVPVVLQAGTMQWRIVPEDKDDGEMATHFGYQWDPGSPMSELSMRFGNLPEIHCWLGIVQSQEVIDFSTGSLKWHAEGLGLRWLAPDPPEFLWCGVEDLPRFGASYIPNRDATLYAASIANKLAQTYVSPKLAARAR